jgi:hypothetical protein
VIETAFEDCDVVRLAPLEDCEEQVIEITKNWVLERNEDRAALDELAAVRRLFDLVKRIGEWPALEATGLRFEGRLIAYSIDEILKPTYALGHFGHAARDVPNASTYLHWRVVSSLHDRGVLWLNNEQDLGHPGLRAHKSMLHPARYVRKFTVSKY